MGWGEINRFNFNGAVKNDHQQINKQSFGIYVRAFVKLRNWIAFDFDSGVGLIPLKEFAMKNCKSFSR